MSIKNEKGKKLLGGEYTQYTPSGFNLLKSTKHNTPNKGDIVYFYSESLKRIAHVGLVIDVTKINEKVYRFLTIEGNTSVTKWDRNGYIVAQKEYTINIDFVGDKNRINCFVTPKYSDNLGTVEMAIYVAKKEIGSKEDINYNNINKFGSWYGNNGVPWCQQFISYIFNEVGELRQRGWLLKGNDWYFYNNSKPLRSEWFIEKGLYYVTDDTGKLIKGWFKSENKWYFLDNNGVMLCNCWLLYKGCYYFLKTSGEMAKDCYILDNGKYWYVNKLGICSSNPLIFNELGKQPIINFR